MNLFINSARIFAGILVTSAYLLIHAEAQSGKTEMTSDLSKQYYEVEDGCEYTQTDRKLQFPIGVYIYVDKRNYLTPGEVSISFLRWLEVCFADISAHRCNSIYLADLTWDLETFKAAVVLAQKYNLYVFAQLAGPMYLRPEKGKSYYQIETLPSARKMMTHYRDLTGIAAWMPYEEPKIGDLTLLWEYRKQLRDIDTRHDLYSLHNSLPVMINDTENLPDWFGFDRYRFRSMFGKYGVMLSTPTDMALRLREELQQFQSVAEKHGRPLIFVMQGYGSDFFGTTEQVLKLTSGVLPPPHSGWKELTPGHWYGWLKYPPPKYGMRLQCWLGILEGVKGFFVYRYNSSGEAIGNREVALVSNQGVSSEQWAEFGETIAHIEPILPLAHRWEKMDIVSASTAHPDVFISAFRNPYTQTCYLVVVNYRIAKWDEQSPRFLRKNTEVRCGNTGIDGLKPAGKLDVVLSVGTGSILFDIIDKNLYFADKEGNIQIEIDPGGGFVFEILDRRINDF